MNPVSPVWAQYCLTDRAKLQSWAWLNSQQAVAESGQWGEGGLVQPSLPPLPLPYPALSRPGWLYFLSPGEMRKSV